MPKKNFQTVSDRVFSFFNSPNLAEWRQEKADRNAKLVQYFYGLTNTADSDGTSNQVHAWPTLEDTGKLWGDLTRERARQIIQNNFVAKVSQSDFPELLAIAEILASKSFWPHSELRAVLTEKKLVEDDFNLKGLFNLMDDLKVNHQCHIITPELSKVSRANHSNFPELFIVNDCIYEKLSIAYKTAKKIAPRCGVAKISHTINAEDNPEMYQHLVWILRNQPGVWFFEEKCNDGSVNHWYAFDNMNNTLISYAEKVFNVLKPTTSARCAEGFHNAMHSRTYDYPYPPVHIIERFLQNCKHFEFEPQTKLLTSIGRQMPMTDIEHAVVSYLSRHGKVMFHPFLEHLTQLSYGEPLAKKNITFSPFIFVDRTLGRKSHTYALLSEVKSSFV